MGIINGLIAAMRLDPLSRIERGLAKAENTQGPFDYTSLYQKFKNAASHLENAEAEAEAVRRLLLLLLEVDSVMVANARSISNRFLLRGMDVLSDLDSHLTDLDSHLKEGSDEAESVGVDDVTQAHYVESRSALNAAKNQALETRESIAFHLDSLLRLYEEMVNYQEQRRERIDGLDHLQETLILTEETRQMTVKKPFSPYSKNPDVDSTKIIEAVKFLAPEMLEISAIFSRLGTISNAVDLQDLPRVLGGFMEKERSAIGLLLRDSPTFPELKPQPDEDDPAHLSNRLNRLGELANKARVSLQIEREAREALKPSANPNVQLNLGLRLLNGEGCEVDFRTAAKLFARSAEQDNASAQCNLGSCYQNGEGVPKDLEKAVEYYHQSAEQGNASAQCNLGWCYEYGKGVREDLKKAVEYYHQSAQQGYAPAQYKLGRCYTKGMGVERDPDKSVECYIKSAKQGYAPAQYKLGRCYEECMGFQENPKQALEWYLRAAQQGHAKAQYKLGRYYEEGRKCVSPDLMDSCYSRDHDVQKDLQLALKWYRAAAKQGHAGAKERLKKLSSD